MVLKGYGLACYWLKPDTSFLFTFWDFVTSSRYSLSYVLCIGLIRDWLTICWMSIGALESKGGVIFRKRLLDPNPLRMFFLFLSNPFSQRAFLSLKSNP